MSRWAMVVLVGCTGARAPVETGPEPEPAPEPEIPRYDARTFFETVSVSGASFSHDESRLLVSTDETGVFNAYSVPVQGGEAVALTQSTTDSIFGLSWFPHDDRFLYSKDQGGNELTHLYVRELDGTDRELTSAPNARAGFFGWTADKSAFFVTTNERDPKFFDLYRYAADGYERKLLFENEGGYALGAVSSDGRWLALGKIRNNADSDLYLLDLTAKGAKPRHVTPHEGEAQHVALEFSHDGARLYYLTDAHGEFMQAWSYTLQGEAHEVVLEADWDVADVSFSEKGRYQVSVVNEEARNALSVLDTSTGQPLALPDPAMGDVTGLVVSPSEARLAFYASGDTSPGDLYMAEAGSPTATRLTTSLDPDIDEAVLVEGADVRYPSGDLEIPAILYKPRQASAQSPVPAVVWVHGGPGGQSRHGYNPSVQHLVNHGYAVLAVNNRGSSGYGKTFFHLDDRRHGEVDLADCVAGRSYLEGLDWVDADKIGIMGGSYGGYMVAAALAFQPEAFDVGIDIFGVTNWLRTLQSIPPWWTSQRDSLYAEMGDPATDQERLTRISPLMHAGNIVKPLLVVQGANDPRVLKVESDELVAAVQKNGVPVEYLVFPDEGHGFLKKENRIRASEAYLTFLEQHLPASAAPAAATP
jgi:dipeptidyl aminopeptidase/acylaminoacyl peptidase